MQELIVRMILMFAILAVLTVAIVAFSASGAYPSFYWLIQDKLGGAAGLFMIIVMLCVLLGLVRYVRYQFQQ